MTSMIRPNDIVHCAAHGYGLAIRYRRLAGGPVWIVERQESDQEVPHERTEADGDLIIICHEWPECRHRAELFTTEGRPVCRDHASGATYTVRPDPHALVTCICGSNLDKATIRRDWTIGDMIAEYRHCDDCGSDRAYMHPDIGHAYAILLDGLGRAIDERASLLDGLEAWPPQGGNTIIRLGVTLAKVVSINHVTAWRLLPPTKES